MAVEAMFWVKEKKETADGGRYTDDQEPGDPMVEVGLEAVYDDGSYNEDGSGGVNEDWARWTPSGEIHMTINNPSASGYFKPGRKYRVTFTEVMPQRSPKGAA